MKCDICGKEANCTVAASAFGPISFDYCDECLHRGKEPYRAVVAYIACAGHFPDDINELYQDAVRRQLKLHNVSEEDFINDVEESIKLYEKDEMTMSHVDMVKEVIKQNIEDALFGIFDCGNTTGDAMYPLLNKEGVRVFICYDYGYFEVLGLTWGEFKQVEEYYNKLIENM